MTPERAWRRKVLRDAAQAGAITGLVLAILLLAGCGGREPPAPQVVDTFCADSSPFPADHAGGLDAVGRRWVHAHNCQGVRRCGWLPGLDPAVCAP